MSFLNTLKDYNKQVAIDHLMGVEGGSKFTDISTDRGGKTRYGVTEAKAIEFKSVWPTYKFNGDMSTLSYELAFHIYETDYWNKLKLDDLSKIHPLLADRLFDIGVNRGTGTAGTYLQRLLNVFNGRGKLYPDMKIDGSIGPLTVNAVKAFVAARGHDGAKALILGLLSLQNTSYIAIAENDSTQEDFSLGWANRVTHGFEAYLPLLATPYTP